MKCDTIYNATIECKSGRKKEHQLFISFKATIERRSFYSFVLYPVANV